MSELIHNSKVIMNWYSHKALPVTVHYDYNMILRVKAGYFLKQQWLTGVSNGEVLCFLWGAVYAWFLSYVM
jgi:hypothetical protein